MIKNYGIRVSTNLESIFLRILGFYRIIPYNKYFIVIENIENYKEISKIYEIQGNTEKIVKETFVSPDLRPVTIEKNAKDLEKIHMNSESFLEIIEDDLKLLEKYNIIGYNILIFFYEKKPETMKPNIFIDNQGKYFSLAIDNFFSFTVSKCAYCTRLLMPNKNYRLKTGHGYKKLIFKVLKDIFLFENYIN